MEVLGRAVVVFAGHGGGFGGGNANARRRCRRAINYPWCRRAMNYPSEWPPSSAGLGGRGGFRVATGWLVVVPGRAVGLAVAVIAGSGWCVVLSTFAAHSTTVPKTTVGATCKVPQEPLWSPVSTAIAHVPSAGVSGRVGLRVATGGLAMGYAGSLPPPAPTVLVT
jgi:hypothetical protein